MGVKRKNQEIHFLHYGNVKDSALVQNNIFYFTGKVYNPIRAWLSIKPVSTINKDFYLGNKNINIKVENKKYKNFEVNFIKIDSIKGTETAILQSNFENF